MSDWRPIETAPKDGRVIRLTWMENGRPAEVWPLRWDAERENGLFPGVKGFWTTPDGSMTWNHRDPAGAPTHWTSDEQCPHHPPGVRSLWYEGVVG